MPSRLEVTHPPSTLHEDSSLHGLAALAEAAREDVAVDSSPIDSDSVLSSESSLDNNNDSLDSESLSEMSANRNAAPSLSHLRQLAKQGAKEHGSKSTKADYQRIFDEYEEFALSIHGNKTVTSDRVFQYLTYTAHRPLRNYESTDPNELNNSNATDSDSLGNSPSPAKKKPRVRHVFNPNHYHLIMSDLKSRVIGEYIEPESDRLQTLDKHYAALMRHCPDNMRRKIQDHQGIRDLREYVKGRKKTADARAYKEKVNPQLEKFKYPELYEKVEKYFWYKHFNSYRPEYVAASMRDRFTMLSTVQCCCRFESQVKCKLSNFQILHFQMNQEADPYSILFRNINVGKTAKADSDKRDIIQAKSIRHKDPQKCEQGALAFYLFSRFRLTDEDFDLNSNQAWFDVHTSIALGDGKVKSMEECHKRRFFSMGISAFSSSIKAAFKYFGYTVYHVAHFGRSCAPVLLEFAEVMTSFIKELGNWDMNVFERSYSSKMGWPALRAAAGFPQEKGNYYLPRQHIKPDDKLVRMVFPNIQRSRFAFESLPRDRQLKLATARSFLDVMDHLSVVFLQDACALLQYPDRREHVLFKDPLFFTPEFAEFHQRFQREYPVLSNPHNDPTHDPLKRHVPLIGNTLSNLNAGIIRQAEILNSAVSAVLLMHEKQDNLQQDLLRIAEGTQHFQHVMDAASAAHNNSPYRTPPPKRATTEVTGGTTTDCAQTVPTHLFITRTSGNTSDTADSTENNYPPLPATYNSLDTMYHDWRGTNNSVFANFGGLQALNDDKAFRRKLTSAQKKSLQKLARINKYFESRISNNETTLENVFEEILDEYKGSAKKAISISGTADILKKVFGWAGN